MSSFFERSRRFFAELRRRNVYRVAVTYAAVGFVVIEAADLTLVRLGLPAWTVTLVIVLVGLGFPIALVLAWALEVTPEGVRAEEAASGTTDSPGETPTTSPDSRDLWIGASVFALLSFGAWLLVGDLAGDGNAGTATSDTAIGGAPEIEERTIAVLPFEVSGQGAEEWRDGMVTMLSMNLDGAAGLRSIDDRTVFAEWERRDSARVGTSTSEALSVARNVGARYAVVGSAVQLGNELRLGAEVHRVGSDGPLGEVQVQGTPGNITALTDRLTRAVLGVLLERSEERIPSVDLASITTESLDALKAFLRGEQHFRSNEYGAAVEDYETAVAKDSTFALAYIRLRNTRFWSGKEGVVTATEKAYELSGQLPERERRHIRGLYLWVPQDRGLAAADSLRRLSEDYPDDPHVWYGLGEVLYHSPVPRGLPEAETAFRRAIQLDPGVPSYYHHHVELAFVLHHDSTLAARRIEAHPAGPRKGMYRLALDLVFGAEARRKQALARIDTVPDHTVRQLFNAIRHPTDGDLRAAVLPRLIERDLPDAIGEAEFYEEMLVASTLDQGKITEAQGQMEKWELESPYSSACLSAFALSLGAALPDSLLRARLEPSRIEPEAGPDRYMCAGIYLVEQDRGRELPNVISRLRETGAEQGVSTWAIQRKIDEMKGYRAFRAGNLREAEELWSGEPESKRWGAIWRGDLYRKLGEITTAEGWYLAAWRHPVAHERLGDLYREMEEPKKARAAYERFVAAWKNADATLQPRVERARQQLRELTGEPGRISGTISAPEGP